MNEIFKQSPDARPPRRNTPSLVLGICIILFGLALTMDQLNVPHASFLIKLWPLILIALGSSKLRRGDGISGGGFILVLLGAYLLIANFSPNDFVDSLWPILLVGLGVFLVMKSLKARRGPVVMPADRESMVEATAVFSGCRRQPRGTPFKGGELTAIFGGIELDLRTAEPSPDPMVVDVFILFGGGEIRVPTSWVVDIRTTSIFGGIGHKAVEPMGGPGAPRLVITGTTLFGGLEIRN